MKRFRFPLRPVAMLRTHAELRAREAFGAAVHAYVKTEQELGATRARVARYEAELTDGRRECFSSADAARALAMYRQECATELQAERVMVAAREVMAKCRAEYLDAHRKLEVVKRLEEKAHLLHRHTQTREEQAEFDDLASRRATRRPILPV